MREFKNDHYYCEICGDKVSHKKAKVIVGHESCIKKLGEINRSFKCNFKSPLIKRYFEKLKQKAILKLKKGNK